MDEKLDRIHKGINAIYDKKVSFEECPHLLMFILIETKGILQEMCKKQGLSFEKLEVDCLATMEVNKDKLEE